MPRSLPPSGGSRLVEFGGVSEDTTLSPSLKLIWRMQAKVLGAERWRRWSYDEKVRLVEEILQAGETVCEVARRHGMAQSPLLTWRRQVRQGRLGGEAVPALVPVEITSTLAAASTVPQPSSSPRTNSPTTRKADLNTIML
ncbi:transposase [Bradyrhizobium ganzhouense]|uniref:transposase n=1 Tax=Bradyrhizobium ganzhouense TaxID=1179767 RepID=UPI003CF3B418